MRVGLSLHLWARKAQINLCLCAYGQTEGFVCVEVLLPSQPHGVMSGVVSLPNHTFTGQA